MYSAAGKDGAGSSSPSLSALQEAEGRQERTSICSQRFKCRQRSAILWHLVCVLVLPSRVRVCAGRCIFLLLSLTPDTTPELRQVLGQCLWGSGWCLTYSAHCARCFNRFSFNLCWNRVFLGKGETRTVFQNLLFISTELACGLVSSVLHSAWPVDQSGPMRCSSSVCFRNFRSELTLQKHLVFGFFSSASYVSSVTNV